MITRPIEDNFRMNPPDPEKSRNDLGHLWDSKLRSHRSRDRVSEVSAKGRKSRPLGGEGTGNLGLRTRLATSPTGCESASHDAAARGRRKRVSRGPTGRIGRSPVGRVRPSARTWTRRARGSCGSRERTLRRPRRNARFGTAVLVVRLPCRSLLEYL